MAILMELNIRLTYLVVETTSGQKWNGVNDTGIYINIYIWSMLKCLSFYVNSLYIYDFVSTFWQIFPSRWVSNKAVNKTHKKSKSRLKFFGWKTRSQSYKKLFGVKFKSCFNLNCALHNISIAGNNNGTARLYVAQKEA